MTATAVETGTQLRPLADRVAVRLVDNEQATASGLVIPDTVQADAAEGVVVAVGPGSRVESGDILPLEVAVGDRIVFSRFSGVRVASDVGEVVLLSERDILAVRGGDL